MRTIGLSEYGYKRQLQEWLDLSIQKNIPISLLIMSRAFLLTSKYSQPEEILKSSMSSLDSEIINEVVLAVAKPEEESSIEIKVRKLESLEFQSDMIREERDDKEEAIQAQKKVSGDLEKKDGGKSGKESIVAPILAPVVPVIGKVVEKVTAVTQAVIKTATTAAGQASSVIVPSSAEGISSPKPSIDVSTSDKSTTPTTNSKIGETDASTPMVAPITQAIEKTKELSVNEIQILGDLARGPSLDREKAELAKIEARVEVVATEIKKGLETSIPLIEKMDLQGESSTADSSTKLEFGESMDVVTEPKLTTRSTVDTVKTSVKELEPKPDPSMARMQSVLNTMVDKLKNRITDTEKALSDKLPKLDTDGDGELSSDELKGAIQSILKRAPTDQEAERIVKILDADNDGKVSVAELVKYAEDKVRNAEVSDLQASVASVKEAQSNEK